MFSQCLDCKLGKLTLSECWKCQLTQQLLKEVDHYSNNNGNIYHYSSQCYFITLVLKIIDSAIY